MNLLKYTFLLLLLKYTSYLNNKKYMYINTIKFEDTEGMFQEALEQRPTTVVPGTNRIFVHSSDWILGVVFCGHCHNIGLYS